MLLAFVLIGTMHCGLGFTAVTRKPQNNFLFTGGTKVSFFSQFFIVVQGVEIVNDELGNVWATRGSKNNIFVKVGENVQ